MNAFRKAWLRGSVLLSILLCIAGCSSTSPNRKPQLSVDDQAEALAHFSLGLLSENSGDSTAALDHFQKAIRIDPHERTIYPQAIASALRLRNNKEALRLCEALRKQQPDELPPLLMHAQVHVLAEQPEKAEALFRKAVQAFPEQADSRLAFSRFLISINRQQEAVDILEQAASKNEDNAEVLNLLGALYIDSARNEKNEKGIKKTILKGIDLLEQSIELAPGNPQQLQQLGYAYLAVQDAEKALDVLETAEKLAPGDVLISRQLLDLYIQEGMIEDALATCDELMRQTRTDPELWTQYLSEKLPEENRDDLADYLQEYINGHTNAPVLYYIQLGSIYLDGGKTNEAETVFSTAGEIYPDDNRLKTANGYMLLQKEQYNKAHSIFHSVKQNAPEAAWLKTPLFIISSTMAAHKSGLTEEAAQILSNEFKKEPVLLAGYMQMIFSPDSPVSNEEAIELLEQVQELLPDAAEPFYYLTLIQADQENYEAALNSAQQFETLAATGSATNLLNAFFYYQHAVINERTGRLEEAETLFRKAIELGKPAMVASAKNYIAYMWAERGEKLDMGLELIFQALENEPDNAAFIDTLGWIYYMQGDYEKALVELQKASELIDDDPAIWEHIGDTYLKLGDNCAAVKYWKKAVELAPEETKLLERIEKHSVSPDDCPAPADSPEDTPDHP